MIAKIINEIKASKGVLLAAHVNPDGDAIGALVGMGILCNFLKIPYTVLVEKVVEDLKHLLTSVHVSDTVDRSYDTFITVDCGDILRLGSYEAAFRAAENTINIDHHITNNHFAKTNYVQEDASSTSELVFCLIEAAGCPLQVPLVEALYTGILTDTGGFMYPCTKASTHRVVAKLLETPFDFTGIYYHLIHEKTEKAVRMQSVAVSRMRRLSNSKVFLSYITEEDLSAYEATRDDLGSIVTYIKNIKGCEVAIFIYPSTDHTYKVSLRSNEPYDVAEIAGKWGGGGHARAAGATVEGEIEEIISSLEVLFASK